MLVTDDGELAERARVLRNHGAKAGYQNEAIGGNFRLDELQAALLRVKLPKLGEWIALRRQRRLVSGDTRQYARYHFAQGNGKPHLAPIHHPHAGLSRNDRGASQ